jgi:NAD(P)-dependent dehydrogenase (short-subunit alcohol dehydrogenase family)
MPSQTQDPDWAIPQGDTGTGPYVEAHKQENLGGPGDARPTGLQILKDEDRLGNMSDKVVLVTGCSSGLGIETVKTFVETGATVYGTARDLNKAKTALGSTVDNPRVHLLQVDLESLDSVRACAAEFRKRSPRLNILINNAGVMATPEGRTKDGFETQFGVNHLAHFLLFNLLKDLVIKSSTPEFNSRVVNLTSSGHGFSPIVWDNLRLEGEYDGYKAYGQSKTANILMANEIDVLFGAQGVHGLSVHPGGIVSGLQKHRQEEMEMVKGNDQIMRWMKSPQQGCATTVFAAVSRELEGKGRVYLENCTVKGQQPGGLKPGWLEGGHMAWAMNRESEERLWRLSSELVGLKE